MLSLSPRVPVAAQGGPVGYWALDDGSGTAANDSSGSGNTGTLFNGPLWTTGRVNGALSFDGVDDYVDVGNSPTLNPSNGITLAAWVNVRNLSRTQMFISKYGTSIQYFLRVMAGGRVRFGLKTGGGQAGPADSTTVLLPNTWYHVAGTYDGAQAKLYVNGVVETSAAMTGTINSTVERVNLGRRSGGMYLNGLLDEVRIYDGALNAQEVAELAVANVDPTQFGRWTGPFPWPFIAIHAILLRTGEVLAWAGQHNGGATAHLWNPATDQFTPVPNNSTNIFCAGHAALADGRILVVGGHLSVFNGVRDANLFDPLSRSWAPAAPMAFDRWYPTATVLPNGRMLVTSGNQSCSTCIAAIPEIYDPTANTWSQLTNASLATPAYAYMFVLPDGRVLNAGSDDAIVITRALDIAQQTWAVVDPVAVDAGSAAMYEPGKVMKSGSSVVSPDMKLLASASTYVLDMTQPLPGWRQVGSMRFPRAYHTLTLLPDGTVLVTGGERWTDLNDLTQAVHEAEIWSPATETWTTMDRMQMPRLYHSVALLLPDGRVLAAGGGQPGVDQLNAEIYSPPYLFRGPRPVISFAPTNIVYSSAFSVVTPDASDIAKVTLLRTGAVTHTFNQDQRFLSLSFQRGSGVVDVQAPANGNLAPPGYYLLFLVNSQGVPSVASFVQLQ